MSKLNVRAIGISNIAWSYSEDKIYGLQFYDYDGWPSPNKLEEILSYFPYDVMLYLTRDGVHFVSLTLLDNLRIPKANTIKLSKLLNEDYWNSKKDLVLRVSDKFSKWRRKRKSSKPEFLELSKLPNKNHPISRGHLEYYRKYMGLPNWVYDIYSNVPSNPTIIQIHFYKTRL